MGTGLFRHAVASSVRSDMVLPIEEGPELSSSSGLRFARIAAIGALAAALGLAGCGRKAGLDPPPGATAADTSPSRPDLEPAIGRQGHRDTARTQTQHVHRL